jgi:hypothetical protein
MHALRVAPGKAMAIGLLITTAAIGCSSKSAPSSVAATTGQPTATAAAPTTSTAATASASSTGVQNLSVSTAVRSELLTAFAAIKNIPVSDVAGSTPGSIYYAYDPSTQTYWAMGSYEPASTDPATVKNSFEDGGETGQFKKIGSGPWQAGTGGVPPYCAEISYFPRTVLEAWSLPTTVPAGGKC